MGYSPYQLVFTRILFTIDRTAMKVTGLLIGLVKLTMDNDLKAETNSMIPLRIP